MRVLKILKINKDFRDWMYQRLCFADKEDCERFILFCRAFQGAGGSIRNSFVYWIDPESESGALLEGSLIKKLDPKVVATMQQFINFQGNPLVVSHRTTKDGIKFEVLNPSFAGVEKMPNMQAHT
ncbi:MAG: hypothetical protein UT48_C0006G0036 [Parcubacteria group bacterium GW2011_GWE2_39_37]|nr:MAG: hypothetical protein UT48_C0006G0036 [Parcubacteria group bacterium GW2011_GWE2_39_37]